MLSNARLALNLKDQLCSEAHTLVGVQDPSSFDTYPALGLSLHYFSALGLCIRTTIIITAPTQRMLELDVKVLHVPLYMSSNHI